MNLQIQINAETESRLKARAAALGKDFVSHIQEVIREDLAANEPDENTARRPSLSMEEWLKEFGAWVGSHRTLPYNVDGNCESLYA